MKRAPAAVRLIALAVFLSTALPAAAADAVFPLASRVGLVPPPGLAASRNFSGFADPDNNVFIRIVAFPPNAFAEIERTMTNEALQKSGMTIAKRETLTLPGGKALLVVASQSAGSVKLQKWLLFAPFAGLTALVSFEVPEAAKKQYPDAVIRAALATVTSRPTVPVPEQLALLPFDVKDLAGFRLVRVVPGVAMQLTDGPHDSFESVDQPHLIISIAPGGPIQPRDRDHFAKQAFAGLPPLKDVRLNGSEPMRINGMQGYEIRALGKDAKSGEDVEVVQWLRFGSGAHLRILAFAPKKGWLEAFTRFRTVRDAIEPR